MTIKTVPFRQYTKTGCGSYTLANLFNSGDYLVGDFPKEGENLNDLNKKLNKLQHDLYLDPIFVVSPYMKYQNRLHLRDVSILQPDGISQNDSIYPLVIVPYIVTFSRPNGALHFVLMLVDVARSRYYIVDSCEEFVNDVNVMAFVREYPVTSVSVFRSKHSNNRCAYITISRDEVAHLI